MVAVIVLLPDAAAELAALDEDLVRNSPVDLAALQLDAHPRLLPDANTLLLVIVSSAPVLLVVGGVAGHYDRRQDE